MFLKLRRKVKQMLDFLSIRVWSTFDPRCALEGDSDVGILTLLSRGRHRISCQWSIHLTQSVLARLEYYLDVLSLEQSASEQVRCQDHGGSQTHEYQLKARCPALNHLCIENPQQ